MIVLQINTAVNSGSTGRIAEDIGKMLLESGHKSYIAYGRNDAKSDSIKIKIGGRISVYLHVLLTAIFDRHGFGSYIATKKLVRTIERINPDVILLHNLHGYFLNIRVLFSYLQRVNKPVVWTLFDCWSFTGHCTYFDDISCDKWEIECRKCPKISKYPRSFYDNSKMNYIDKKKLFLSISNLTLVTHSQWLANVVGKSFFSSLPIIVTPSATSLSIFKPTEDCNKIENGRKIILGVANPWSERKGLNDFIALQEILSSDFYTIVLIGLTDNQIKNLPTGIKGINKTESILDLAKWYNKAFVFVNPTYQDNFPTTNIEALGCGTPVITYNTGGSPEAIDPHTGVVVPKGDINALKFAIEQIEKMDYELLSIKCRERAELLFDKNKRFKDYLKLVENLVLKNVK